MGQNDKVNSLQTWGANLIAVPWMLLTNASVNDDLVYNLVKVIHGDKEALGASFGAFNCANFEAMAPANVTPYHPGAIRFFEESGVLVSQ
jgi:TRAP-type uncharacterized transport system substrate-binding protein